MVTMFRMFRFPPPRFSVFLVFALACFSLNLIGLHKHYHHYLDSVNEDPGSLWTTNNQQVNRKPSFYASNVCHRLTFKSYIDNMVQTASTFHHRRYANPIVQQHYHHYYSHRKQPSDNDYHSQSSTPITFKYFPRAALLLRGLCRTVPNFLSLVIMGYCLLFLTSRIIVSLVFTKLRPQERHLIRDRFSHFLFFNLLYVFILSYVQTLPGVFLWGCWFSILSFCHLMTILATERFEFLTFSPSTTPMQHAKLIGFLVAILLFQMIMTVIGFVVGQHTTGHVLFFMLSKVGVTAFVTLHVLAQYAIHLYDIYHQQDALWLSKATVKYYTNFFFDVVTLSLDFGHHLHLLVWGNIFLSVACFMVAYQLKYLTSEISVRLLRHLNYRRLATLMEERFPMVQVPEETCAICWSPLTISRQLPCNHLFHDTCLRAWLEQDISCPTCRHQLAPLVPPPQTPTDTPAPQNPGGNHGNDAGTATATAGPEGNIGTRRTTHFFHFDGSRYFSWLPSLHVEFSQESTAGGLAEANLRLLSTGSRHRHQLTPLLWGGEMEEVVGFPAFITGFTRLSDQAVAEGVDQLAAIFPHFTRAQLEADLRQSGSPEATVENIVERRLVPHDQREMEPSETASSSQPSTSTDTIPDLTSLEIGSQSEASLGGTRFSKSAQERENLLAARKRDMVLSARRKFVHHPPDVPSTPSLDSP